jgi:tRNA(adenine34) deaminase
MQVALEEAATAAASGDVPVGAVVAVDDRIIARARNMMRASGDPTAHAELLAIRAAVEYLRSAESVPVDGGNSATEAAIERRLEKCTLVVTLEPCAMCAGAIVLARVGRLVFGAWDDKAGMCGSVGDLVRHPRLNHRPEVSAGVLQEHSAQLLHAFFAARRESDRRNG